MTRIAIHDYSGHPFQLQLAEELSERGHDVTHISCSSYISGKGNTAADSLEVVCISLGRPFEKYRPFMRLRQELQYAARFLRHARGRYDVVVMCNVPLLAHLCVAVWLRLAGVRTVFWHQDVYSVAIAKAARQRLGRILGWPIATTADRVERFIARSAQAIVVISPGFLRVHERWGTTQKVVIQPNWAPLEAISPRPRDNSWARMHGLNQGPVVLYSGTLGLKHDLSLFKRLHEELLRLKPDITFVVVSEGAGADALGALDSGIRRLPFQPFSLLADVLGAGDILLTILEADASEYSVPSKTLSYFCAGRPVLALLPKDNPAYEATLHAGGLAFDPSISTIETIARQVSALLSSERELENRGNRARQYAEQHFSIAHIADRFEAVVFGVAGADRSARIAES